jgi:hypothetical protein
LVKFYFQAAQNRWEDALKGYAKAVQLAPAFSFAAANYALVSIVFNSGFVSVAYLLVCDVHHLFGPWKFFPF